MRRSRIAALAAAGACIVALAAVTGALGGAKAAPQGKLVDHVVVLMLENHSKSSVLGDANAPYMNQLAEQYAVAGNYYGVTHPSEPNYVASISGDTWGVNDDRPTNRYDHWNLVDQLEASNVSWAAYMESMPSTGFVGDQYPADAALYVNKHNPFVLFDDIRNSSDRLARVKPYADFAADMAKGMPNVVWISPNQCHDMHGGVYTKVGDGDGTPCPYGSTKDDANDAALKQKADDFVKGAMQTIMSTKEWKGGRVAVFVVTDENDYTGNPETDGWEDASGCCDSPNLPLGTQFLDSHGHPDGHIWAGGVYGGGLIPAIVVTNHGKQGGFTSDRPYNHYSLLATIESNWKLGYLGRAADHVQVQPMREFLSK